MKFSNPANSTMSSNFAVISFLDSPRIAPFMNTFSRPDSSGWNPAPSSSKAEIRPFTVTDPLSGVRIPVRHFNNVLLPEPLLPITPNVVPVGTVKSMPRNAQNSS
jgi:hypothetical protein